MQEDLFIKYNDVKDRLDSAVKNGSITQKDFADSNTVISLDSAFCFAAYDAKLVNCDTGATGISAEIKINGDSGYKVLINKNGQIGQTSP